MFGLLKVLSEQPLVETCHISPGNRRWTRSAASGDVGEAHRDAVHYLLDLGVISIQGGRVEARREGDLGQPLRKYLLRLFLHGRVDLSSLTNDGEKHTAQGPAEQSQGRKGDLGEHLMKYRWGCSPGRINLSMLKSSGGKKTRPYSGGDRQTDGGVAITQQYSGTERGVSEPYAEDIRYRQRNTEDLRYSERQSSDGKTDQWYRDRGSSITLEGYFQVNVNVPTVDRFSGTHRSKKWQPQPGCI
ncbi:hypothetical protein DFH09DRAFT_1079369 [Mycena vulgaris]|nr:hypothetical protein DFH09DRAFT_1079369 [Mycena vulgaris]